MRFYLQLPGTTHLPVKSLFIIETMTLLLVTQVILLHFSEHAATGMQFGSSISTDGDLLIISAPNDNSFAGSIFLYLRNNNGDYQFLEKIISQTPAAGETFGYKVLIDDSWLFVSSLQIANSGGQVKLRPTGLTPTTIRLAFIR